jgi:hypothetical protein
MIPPKFLNDMPSDAASSVLREDGIESSFIGTFQRLNHVYKPDRPERIRCVIGFVYPWDRGTRDGREGVPNL